MSEIHFDEQVDITDVVCPVTFVKAKVALEEMDEGQVLAVKMASQYRMFQEVSKKKDIRF